MRHPLWILNSIILVTGLIVLGFIFFTAPEISEQEEIDGNGTRLSAKSTPPAIVMDIIYENDLFGTHHVERELEDQIKEPPIPTLPAPPAPSPVFKPQESPVQFMDPLNITLKGIMVFSINNENNKIIVEDNKTKAEQLYRVGDKIADAQLISIANNKAIFVRSNGQQEVLYVREDDAALDPMYVTAESWGKAIIRSQAGDITILLKEFAQRVVNLGQLIDLLDVSTVYQKGESAGIRIGRSDADSLVLALGLQTGDIVQQVNGMSVKTTQERFDAYKKIVGLGAGDSVSVIFKRGNQDLALHYHLKDATESPKREQQESRESEIKRLQALQKKQTFAPTFKDIREREKSYMKQHGGKSGSNNRPLN